ncbi:MAG: DUF6525 family protein [Rhodoplanes sp.]
MTNDLLPGNRYLGPLDEFEAFDRLPRAVRRALDAALFQWSAADCLERLDRGETVSGLIDLIRQADSREAGRRVSRSGRTGKRGRAAMP